MQRRKFSRECKLEAVRLVKERGVAVTQAARDLDVHENVLRKATSNVVSAARGSGPIVARSQATERAASPMSSVLQERRDRLFQGFMSGRTDSDA